MNDRGRVRLLFGPHSSRAVRPLTEALDGLRRRFGRVRISGAVVLAPLPWRAPHGGPCCGGSSA
jgi:hypothetical protein